MRQRERNENEATKSPGGTPDETTEPRAQSAGRECSCEHLLRQQEFLRTLMDASPAYFVAIDRDNKIIATNRAMLDALGHEAEDVVGRDYVEAMLPESSKAQYLETKRRILEGNGEVRSVNRLLTKDGDELLVEWHGRRVSDESAYAGGFFGVGIDITEHRRAQEQLRTKSEEAQEYLDLAGVIFVGLNSEGCVSLINKQGCSVLGGTQEQIVGKDWFSTFLPDKNRQQVREVFDDLMSGRTDRSVETYENAIVSLTGERKVIEWHNSVLTGKDGTTVGTMASGIDITERKRAEDVQRLAYRIGSSIHTASSVQELFGWIRQALGDVMNTENFFIALYNRANDTLSLSYFVDQKDQDHFDSFPAGKTLTGYIIKNDQSLLIDRHELDKWTEAGIVDMVGTPSLIWLGVPLRVSGEVIGALVVQSYDDTNEFGEADKEMLEFVSEQIGFAIEHKRAEDELLESEAKNSAILDALPDLMFRLDREGTFLSYDAPPDAPLAMPPEAFLGKNIAEVFPPAFGNRVMECANRVLNTGEMQLMEYSIPVPMPEGELRDFEARMVLSGDGTVLTLVRDITESKRADKFLKTLNAAALQMERCLRPDEIFSAAAAELTEIGMASGIFLTDGTEDSLRMAFTSLGREALQAGARLLGITVGDMHSRIEDIELFRGPVHDRRTVYLDNMVEFFRAMLPLRLKKFSPQLQRTLDVRKAILAPLISDDRVFGVLSVYSDELNEKDMPAVTAFANQMSAAWRKATLVKELEQSIEELRETQDQLLQAQKMEAVGRLAGGVAHDFNNLLTAISGYAELLSCDSALSEQVHGDIEQIRKAAGQAASLTRQLLAFSRRQPLQPVVIDLNKTVVDMNAMLRRLIGEDIELITAIDQESCQTKADPGQVEQVIINLVVNARDAMPEGGKVTITTRDVTLTPAACANMHDARPGHFVCLSIEDTGSGIEREVIDQIFEPFFSTKGPAKGTGLGLAVVYGIIRQHGGWINVYSEPSQGTAFKVYLPSTRPEARAKSAPVDDETQSDLRGSGERILLIEDEDGVRQLAARALTENGYVVFEAAAADEALALFQEQNGDFNLVFSDVVLPDKSGIKLIDELLKLKPDLQVLVSSGYTDQKSQWPVIQEKGFRFLQKPYSIVDLLGTVDELV